MLSYDEFVTTITGKLRDRYPDRTVDVHRVKKPNRPVLDGLTMVKEGNSMSPMLYLNELYSDMEAGAGIDMIMEDIDEFMRDTPESVGFDTSLLRDFDFIKKHIIYKLINYENNEEMLREMPHRRFLDLAVIYCFVIEDESFGTATSNIFNSHMKLWETDENTLYEAAARNTPNIQGCSIKNIDSLISDMCISQLDAICEDGCDEDEEVTELKKMLSERGSNNNPMYVLTNDAGYNGAACIMYKDVLNDFAEAQGEDFYVLPSSVHEVILLPVSYAPSKCELEDMVRGINLSEVDVEDRLSDHVYRYFLKDHMLIF